MAPEKQETAATTVSLWAARWEKTKAFTVKNYLPIAFLVALGLALAWPVPGRFLANVSILGNVRICQVAPMVLVFFITGLQLNTSEVKRALAPRNLPVVVYGFVAILIATPCLGFALRSAPLHPWEFAIGLAIFTVAPTTLGVGVALTEACGGNRAMALLLTIGTNALAVFTMPPELRLLLPQGQGGRWGGGGGIDGGAADSASGLNVNVQVTDLLVKLAITVLVPFTLGKVLREVWPAAERFARSHRVPLSLSSTTSLAFVVWQTLSAARDLLLAQRPGPVFAMMGLAVAMHAAYLLANYLVVWFVLRAPLREAIAVVIMSSQKSAPVAVTTITFMTRDAAQQGLLSLPAIVGQLSQIFIGAALARWLSTLVKRAEQQELADAEAAAALAAQEASEQNGGRGDEAAVFGAAATTAQPAGELQLAAAAAAAGAIAASSVEKGDTDVNVEWNADGAAAAAGFPDASEPPASASGTGSRGGGGAAAAASAAAAVATCLGPGSVSAAALDAASPTRGSASLEARPPSGRLAEGGGDGIGGVAAALPPAAALQRIPGQPSPPVL